MPEVEEPERRRPILQGKGLMSSKALSAQCNAAVNDILEYAGDQGDSYHRNLHESLSRIDLELTEVESARFTGLITRTLEITGKAFIMQENMQVNSLLQAGGEKPAQKLKGGQTCEFIL